MQETQEVLIQAAIKRITRGLQYGEDMESSRLLCFYDARALLDKVIEMSESAVAKADALFIK